jgi:pyrroloquinoline quinone biosynthesis protein B
LFLVVCHPVVIEILGSAAGGGVPQWNCGCRQCEAARSGQIAARTQCSVAITVDERRWILVNASPDLRSQLLRFGSQPPSRTRQSPIEAILLSDADLDHVLGLFLLREDELPVSIHASSAIKEAVEKGLRITEILSYYCGLRWVTSPSRFEPLLSRAGTEIGLEYRAIEIKGPGPRYCRDDHRSCRLCYLIRESATGKTVLVAPAVAQFEPQLLAALNEADAILFDGTFWSDEDFQKSGIGDFHMTELLQSHLPILSGSLERLTAQPAKHKVYLHINNTNPILWNSGPERRRLDEFGIEVAADGRRMEI